MIVAVCLVTAGMTTAGSDIDEMFAELLRKVDGRRGRGDCIESCSQIIWALSMMGESMDFTHVCC